MRKSHLAHLGYPVDAGDLWRFVPLPHDETMAFNVATFVLMDDGVRKLVRARLSSEDCYTLLVYSQRAAAQAIRTKDAGAAILAFDALTMVEAGQVDRRHLTETAGVAAYAAQRVGLDAARVVWDAAEHADGDTAELMIEAVDDELDYGRRGVREVAGPDGPVLVDSNFQPYAPECELAGLALRAARTVEATSRYRAVGITVDDLIPPAWLSGGDAQRLGEALSTLTGVASVYAVPRSDRGPDYLMVYLAEAATAEDGATIAGAAQADRPSAVAYGVAWGRLCAVVVASAVDQPPRETADSLARFTPLLADLLAGAVTV